MRPDQKKPYIDLHVHIADLDSMRTAKRLMPFLRRSGMASRLPGRIFFGRDVNLRGGVSNSLFLSRLTRWVQEKAAWTRRYCLLWTVFMMRRADIDRIGLACGCATALSGRQRTKTPLFSSGHPFIRIGLMPWRSWNRRSTKGPA